MPSSTTAIRVLLVDDDELLLRAVRRSIRGHLDIHLITMTSAIEALETLHETLPDVIVLDAFMPELDGVEACRRIKASPYTRDIEVVLTSIDRKSVV